MHLYFFSLTKLSLVALSHTHWFYYLPKTLVFRCHSRKKTDVKMNFIKILIPVFFYYTVYSIYYIHICMGLLHK